MSKTTDYKTHIIGFLCTVLIGTFLWIFHANAKQAVFEERLNGALVVMEQRMDRSDRVVEKNTEALSDLKSLIVELKTLIKR